MLTAKIGIVLGPLGVLQCSPKRECRCGRASVSFGSTAVKGNAKTETALGPLRITQCQAKNKSNTTASAITNSGAPTRSVNASR